MAVELVRRAKKVPRLTATQKLVLVEYADRANAEQVAWGSAERMAADLGISTRSVHRARARLERRGLLVPVNPGGGRGNSAEYLVLPKPSGNGDNLSEFHGKHRNPSGRRNPDKHSVKDCHPNPQIHPRVRGPAVQGPVSHANGKQKTEYDSAAVQLWLADHPDEAASVRAQAAHDLGALAAIHLLPDDRKAAITEKLVHELASKRMAG